MHDAPPETSVLRPGTAFEGLLMLPGPARIDGRLRGTVISGGPVWIGRSGDVEADLEADIVVIAGRVRGDVSARSLIELESTAEVEGDLAAPRVSLAEGSRVNGRCRTGPGWDSPASPAEREA